MEKYNSLKSYLTTSINEASNSGIGKFWGILGSFFQFTKKEELKDDPITKLLAEQEATAEKNIEDRLKSLEQSREAAYIEKLKTKFAAKEKQLDLENNQRIKRYNVAKERLANEQKLIAKSKTIRTSSQMDAYMQSLDEAFDQASGIPDDAKKLQDTIRCIVYKPDGSPRTSKEINQFTSEGEGKEMFEEYKQITGKNSQSITDAVNSKDFQDFIQINTGHAVQRENAARHAEETAAALEDFNNKSAAIDAYKNQQKHADDAQNELNTANAKKTKFDELIGENTNIDNLTSEQVADIVAKKIINKRQELIDSGADADTISAEIQKIENAYGISVMTDLSNDDITEDKIKTAISSKITDDNEESIIETAKNNLTNEKRKIDNNITTAQEKVNQIPEKIEKGDKTDDEYKQAIIAEAVSKGFTQEDAETYANNIVTYESMPEVDKQMLSGDKTQDPYKSNKQKLENAKKEADAALQVIDKAEDARRQRAVEAHESREKNKMFKDIEGEISKATQGANPGEYIKITTDSDGKKIYTQGYYNDNGDFVERPTDEAQLKEYEKTLQDRLLTGKNNLPTKFSGKITKNGDKYLKDGQEISKDEAINILAAQQMQKNVNMDIIAAKQSAIKDLKSIIKTETNDSGEKTYSIDKEKFDKLSPEQKESILKLVSNPDEVCKGVDISGSLSIDSVKDTISSLDKNNLPEELKTAINNSENTNNTNSDGESNTNTDDYDDGNGNDEDYEDEDNEGSEDEDLDDLEDDDFEDDDINSDVEQGENGKSKVKNPAKVWKRRKNKRTGKTTKSYYNGKKDENGNKISISAEEYKEKVKHYKKLKAKRDARRSSTTTTDQNSLQYSSLKNYLIENLK